MYCTTFLYLFFDTGGGVISEPFLWMTNGGQWRSTAANGGEWRRMATNEKKKGLHGE
jgi:hypothetical protein